MAKSNTGAKVAKGKMQSTWLSNALKSVGAASTDVIKEMFPATSETVGSVTKTATDLAVTIRQGRTGNRTVMNALKQNPVIKMGQDFFKNAVDEIKTGEIYRGNNAAGGLGEGNAFEGPSSDDVSFGDISDEGGNAPDITIQNTTIEKSDNNASIKAMQKTTELVVKSTKQAVDTMVTIGSNSMMQNASISKEAMGYLSSIDNNIKTLLEFANSNMKQYFDASIAFYQGQNKAAEAASGGVEDTKVTQDTIFGEHGGFDIRQYASYVKQNAKEAIANEGVGAVVQAILEYKDRFISDPIGIITKGLISGIVPEVTKKAALYFDNSLKNFIPSILERIGDMGDDPNSSTAVAFISRVFGIKGEQRGKLDFSNIKKNVPVPYNGIANHTIVEIVPKYLRESNAYLKAIAEAVTGKSGSSMVAGSQMFDWNTGTFKDMSKLQYEAFKQIADAETREMSGSDFGRFMSKQKEKLSNEDDKANYEEALNELYMLMSAHNGQINLGDQELIRGLIGKLNYSGDIKALLEGTLGAVGTNGALAGSLNSARRSARSARNRIVKQINESAPENGTTALYSDNAYYKHLEEQVKTKDEDVNKITPNSSIRNRGLKGTVEQSNASINGTITATTGRKTGVESWLENIYNLLDRGIYVETKRNIVTRAKRESANSNASPTPSAEQTEQINASVVTKTAAEYNAEILNEMELEQNQRDTDTNVLDSDGVRTIAGKRSARLLNYMGDVLNGILSGNADAAWDKLTNVFTDYVKKAGDFVSEHFLDPIKKQLFGSKNEDGYNEGGILGGVSNTGRELFFSLRRMVTGAGYTKADGTVIEDASGDELNDTIIGKVKNLVKDIKDGISVRLFGEKDEEGNVTKEGLVGKAKGKFGEVTNSLLEGLHNWKIALFGESDDPEDGPEKTWETIKEKAKKFVPAGIFAILAGRGIASTVGGILGNLSLGPAGALIGLGAAVASHSDKFKDWLFGPEGDQGRIGGIISQKTQEFFKTNKKFITGGAALGAITGFFTKGGLLGTLVGGPVAGALMGLGSSIILKSDMFHKFLFGDEETGRVGLLKTVKGMFGKFGKNMNPDTKTTGMLGAGAAAGALTMGALTSTGILGLSFGIGGPIGGALVGLGASILAQKENFKEWLFGTTDDEGNRKEGFLGKFRNMLLVKLINPMITGAKSIGRDFKSFLYYDIFDKFNLIIKPVGDAIFGTLSNITGKAMSSVAQVAEYIRTDFLDSFVERTAAFLEPVKAAGGAMVKAIYGAGKAIAKAPLDILYAMTNPIFTAVNKVFTTAITTTFKTIDNVIVKPVKNLVIKPLAKITETAFKVVTTPFKVLNDAVIRISDGINQKFAQISRFFGLIGENIKDGIHKAIFDNPLSQGIKKLFGKVSEFKDHVINFSKMAMEPVREVVTATINEVKKTVKDTVGKMMHGILTALNPLNWVRAISSLFTGEKPAKTENRTGLFGYLKNTWDRAKAGVEPRRDASKMSYSDLRRAHRRDRLYAKKRTYYVNEETGERYLETEDGGYLNEKTNQKLSRRDFNKLPGRAEFRLETVGEDGKVEVRRKNSIDKQRDYNRNLIAKWTGYQQTQDTAANRALAMAEARKKGKPLHFKDIAYEETIEEKNAKILAEQHDAVIEGNVTEKETLNVLVEIKDHLLSWMGDQDAKTRIQARKDERERRKVRNATIMEDLPQDPNDIIAAGEENAAIAGSARASGADNADDIIAKTKANRAAHLARLMSKETNKKGFFGRLGDTIKYRSAVFKSEWDTYRSEYDKKKTIEEANAAIENLPHHAEGTDNAKPGLAVVGEQGPELVQFNGGERVVPNESTMGILYNAMADIKEIITAPFQAFREVINDAITTVKTKVAEFGEHVVEFLKHNPITDFVREQKNRLKDTLKQVFAPLHELKDHIKAVIIEDIKAGIMAPFKAIAAPFKLLGKGIGKVKNALGIESLGIFDKFKEAWDKTDPAKKKEREAQAQTKPVVEAIDEKASATIDKMEGINTNVEKVISAVESLAPEIAKSLKPEMESISPTMESIALPSLAGLSSVGGANAGISMPSISAEGNIGDALAQASVSGLTAANMKAKMAEEKEVNTDNARDESRNTLLTEIRDKLGSHHKTWDSIFSKKGLITAGLIMLAPLAIKALKKILSLFNNNDNGGGGGGGQSLASKVVNAAVHTVERIFGDKQFLEETGGLGDGRSTKEATADEVADLKESVAQLLDGNVGGALNTFLFDENGTVNNSTGARAKWLAHLAANTTAKGVGIYSGIKAGEVGTTLAHTLTPQGNKTLAKEGSKTMVTVGKDMMKNGFNLAKGAGGIDDITKGAMSAIGKAKTGEEAARLTQTLTKDLTKAGASPETIAKASAAAEAAGRKALEKGAMQVDDITRFSTKFLDGVAKAVKKATGKDVGQAIAKISPKISEGIAKNLPAISKRVAGVLEMTAGLAVTGVGLLAKESTWIVLGACNGLSGAQRLFKTDQTPDFLMLKISSALGAFTGSTVGMIMDIINEIIVTTTGQDIFYLLACAIYEIVAGSEKAEALMKSQEEFKEQYKTDTIEELRKQYTALLKTNNISSDVSEEEFIKMAQSGEASAHIQSFANYNDEQHKTWGAKLWDKTIDPMMERVFGRTVNKYTDANGIHYEENRDGTYQAYDANGNNLGYVHKDYVVNNATLDHTSGVSEKTSAYGENWQAGKHMIQDWYENTWTPAAGNAMLATGDFFKNFGSNWKTGVNNMGASIANGARNFADNWKSGANSIGSGIKNVGASISNGANNLALSIGETEGYQWLERQGDAISTIFNEYVTKKILASVNMLKDTSAKAWDNIIEKASFAVNTVKDVSAKAWDNTIDKVSFAANTVKDVSGKAWGHIANTATATFNAVMDASGKAWGHIKDAAVNAFTVIKSLPIFQNIRETVENIKNTATAAFAVVKTKLSSDVNTVKTAVITAGTLMKKNVAEAKTNIVNTWKGIFTGLWDHIKLWGAGVKEFFGGIGDWFVKTAGNVKDFFGSLNPFAKKDESKANVWSNETILESIANDINHNNSIKGYATGTQNANKGYALVGETGPELVYMRGGEKVYTNDETKAILGGRGVADTLNSPVMALQATGNTLYASTTPMVASVSANYNKVTKITTDMAKLASSGSIDKLWNTKAEFNSADPLSGLWSGISNVNRIMYTAVGAVPNMLGKVGEIAGAITTSLKSKVSAISNFINSKVSMITSGGRGYFRGGRGSVAGSAISDALSRAGDRQISSGMIDSILNGVSDPNQLLETDAISNIGKKYGIEVTKYPNPSAHTISSMIDEGNPILLYGIDDTAGNSSPYTKSGHFITSQHIDPLRNTMSITDPRYGSKQVKYPEKSVYDSTRYMWGFHRKPKKLPNKPIIKGARGVWRNRNLIIRGGRGYVEGIPTEMNPNAGDKERMLAKCNSYMGQSGSHFFSVWGMTTHWCAMFISTCARESGNDKIIPWDSSCSSQVKWWKANNRWVDKGSPQVGDIVYFDWDQPTPQNDSGYPDRIYDHVGIVAKVNGSKITTIEGNTGGDAPTGTSVNSYTYDTSDINVMGYGRPAYGDSNWVPGSSTTSATVTGGTDNSLLSALSTNIGVLASEAFDAAITGNTKIDWENKFQKYEPYATPSSDSAKSTTSSDSSSMTLGDKLNVAANLTDSKLVKTAATVVNAAENAKSGGNGGRGAYFSQNDPAWKNTKLIRSDGTDDGSTMGNSGCGPTAMAMALSDSVGKVIDPITLANYSKAAGFSDETGTNWDFMNSAANKFGVATSQIIEPSARDLKQAMSLGTPVVLSGVSDDSSTYTTAGHYVVAEGMDKNGNVLIKDPRGRSYNKKMNVSDLEGETTSAWAMLPGGRGTFKKLGKKFWNMFRGGRGDGEIIVQAMREAISYLGKSDWYPRTAGGLLRATLMKANFPADYYQNITETGYNKTLAKLGKDTDRITLYSRGTDVFNNNKMGHASGDVGLRRGDIVVSHSIPAVFLQYVTNGGKSGAEVVRFDDAVNHGINSTTIWYEEKGTTKVRVYRYSRKPQTNKTSTTTSNTSSFDTSELNDLMTSLGDTSSFGDMNFSNIMSNGVFGSILGENSVWSKVTSKLGKFATAAYEAAATGNFNINWDKVFAEQQEATTSTSSSSTYSGASLTGNDNMEKIYNYLRGKGYTPEGTAGVMGNLRAESGLIPNNLQNSYERSLGYSDESYTSAVDSGNYSRDKFIHDSAGYGLAQWTYWDRKQNLYDFVKGSGASIGDLGAQLAFLDKELSEKYSMLKSTNSLKEASNIILHKFENPAEQGPSVENYRASLGQEVYNAMGGKGNAPKITGYNPAPYEIRNRRGGKGVKVTGVYIPKRRYATGSRGIGDTTNYTGTGIEPVDVTMQTTRSYTPYSTYSYRNSTDVDRIESMMVQMVNALNSISSDSKNLAMLKDINNGIASAGSLSATHNSVTNNIITGGKGDDTKPVVKQTRRTSTSTNPTMSKDEKLARRIAFGR